MSVSSQALDAELIMHWLDQAGITHYVCGDCHGLHLSDLQALDGVLESRLFVESDCLLMFTELEIRPSMLMAVLAEISRFNLNYSHLKVFVDLIDDSLPRLVLQDTMPHLAGLTYEQFHLFMDNCLEAVQELVQECQQMRFVTGPTDDMPPTSRSAMH